nr:MAG TPA: hypothetical protein [Caudoviricetes sp.]
MIQQIITVTLPSNVVSVTGTVNSVPVTWAKQSANVWRAVADKSADNLYHVEITTTNAAGTSATYALDLTGGMDLITDRTSPGKYDWEDYNRVGRAVLYLQNLLYECGYLVDAEPITDWSRADIPTIADLERYLANVQNLRAKTEAGALMPELPATMSRITWQGANAIEEALELLEFYIFRMMEAWIYSNEVVAGEV